jgi:hypothetical protein
MKQITVYRAPLVLCVHLKVRSFHLLSHVLTLDLSRKRFRPGAFGKVTKHIACPAKLDLKFSMSPGGCDAAPEYALFAVIVHLDRRGSAMFGHYVAIVRVSGTTGELVGLG